MILELLIVGIVVLCVCHPVVFGFLAFPFLLGKGFALVWYSLLIGLLYVCFTL